MVIEVDIKKCLFLEEEKRRKISFQYHMIERNVQDITNCISLDNLIEFLITLVITK